MKKISVIIPTLQRDVETLNNLVSTLVNDAIVDEILIIDNSLQNYSFNNEKVRGSTRELVCEPKLEFGCKRSKK